MLKLRNTSQNDLDPVAHGLEAISTKVQEAEVTGLAYISRIQDTLERLQHETRTAPTYLDLLPKPPGS